MIYSIRVPNSFASVMAEIDITLSDLFHFLERGTQELVNEAIERMKDNHGRDAHDIQRYVNRTWNLTNSLAGETKLEQFTNPIRLTTTFKADTDYAEAVEFGTPTSRPYPFFWVEVHRFEIEAVDRATNAFIAILQRLETIQRALP